MSDGPRLTWQTLRVLRVLLDDVTSGHYGLELSKAAGLPSGTIYPILARLEKHGWLQGTWESIDPVQEGRPPRRYYTLTGEGARDARAAIEDAVATLRGLTPASPSAPGRPTWA